MWLRGSAVGSHIQHHHPELYSNIPGTSTEMEVTEILLAKISRFCQLSSHSRVFFLVYRFFGFDMDFVGGGGGGSWVGWLKIIFDKTAFVKILDK
jgi:hypothetical protein